MIPSISEKIGSAYIRTVSPTLPHKMDKKSRAGRNVADVKHDPLFMLYTTVHTNTNTNPYMYVNQKYLTVITQLASNPISNYQYR